MFVVELGILSTILNMPIELSLFPFNFFSFFSLSIFSSFFSSFLLISELFEFKSDLFIKFSLSVLFWKLKLLSNKNLELLK